MRAAIETDPAEPLLTPIPTVPPATGAAVAASSAGTAAPEHERRNAGDLAWRIVGLASVYRLILPPALYAIEMLTRPAPSVGSVNPRLFVLICVIYWTLGGLVAFGGRGRWRSRRALIGTHILLDTAAISALLYCSGGVASGLGILLVIPVGAMALLAEGAIALAVAAIATLGLLIQQILVVAIDNPNPGSNDYPLAGILGAVLFLVALSAWPISERLRESEALVRKQEVDLANLAQLSQYILQHLRESILVLDTSDRIRLINEAAAELLGDSLAVPGALIGEVSPRLLYLLTTWRSDGTLGGSTTFIAADGARVIRPHFARLGSADPAPVIVFLEDTTRIAGQVQQSKLAALGRLSASIAHEIRNPVGAISHAAQLLAESSALDIEDRRLTEIMQTHSTRVSGIIDNVLQLSRRELPKPSSFPLGGWLFRFREEFCATLQLPWSQLVIDPSSEDVEVRIDATQLHQIVWNLCQNSVTHALPHSGGAPITLRHGRLGGIGRAFLEVADRGPGIAPADLERIFEPFFTRTQHGTGLGLFLARELAQSNGATLLYEPREAGGSVFRIVFANRDRWVELHA